MPRQPKLTFFKKTFSGDGFFFWNNRKKKGENRVPIFTYGQLRVRRKK